MKKKIANIGIIAVLTLALIISSFGVFNLRDNLSKELKIDATNELTAQAVTSLAGGGTASDPFLIGAAADLEYLADQVAAGNATYRSAHYRMTASISVTRNPWKQIGNEDYLFNGVFDGAGYTISGVSIKGSNLSDQGLFGKTDTTAVIKNLGVINTNLDGEGFRVGGIVGYNKGKIINCFHSGKANGKLEVGGIAGINEGEIINCYNYGADSVVSLQIAGGIVGKNLGSITNCYNAASVINQGLQQGGIVGITNDNKTSYSYFLKNSSVNSSLSFSGQGNCSSCDTFSDNGATILDRLNQQVSAYNATKPKVKAAQWIQSGSNFPSFVWDVSIDETKITTPYNGAPQAFVVDKPNIGVASEFTVKYRPNGSAEAYTTTAPTKVGSYDVNVTRPAKGNYAAFDKTIENWFEIGKKVLTVTPGVALTKVYDGNTTYIGEIVYGTNYTLDKVGAEDVTLTIDNAKTFNSKNTSATTVKIDYTAVLTGADKDNYTIVAGSFDNPATITAKPLTNIKTEKEHDGNPNFSLTLSSANCDGFIANDVVSITFTTAKPDKGTYTGSGQVTILTRTGADKDNYSFTEANITAEITNRKLPAITGITNTIYNGSEQPVTPVLAGTTTADYTLSWEYAVNGIDFAVETAPKFKNAGTYRVTATGTGNYVGSTSVGDYIIAPKVVTLNWQTPATFVYNGKPIIPTVSVNIGDLISADTFGVTGELTNGSNINVGTFTYTAKATAPLNTNYALPATVTKDYAITKATDANIWTKTLTITSITEGGTLNPIATPKYGTAEFTYYSDSAKTTKIAKPTTAGKYYVTAKVEATTSYNGITETDAVEFRIDRQTSGGGSGGGGGIPSKDVFWIITISDINNNSDTVIKKECDYGTMPKKVLEAIQNKNKTLDITMMGENLYITSEKIKGLTFDKTEYTIEEIKAMLAEKPAITPTPTPTPTEKPSEPVPEEQASLTWAWVYLAIFSSSIVIALMITRNKKAKEPVDNNADDDVDDNADDDVDDNGDDDVDDNGDDDVDDNGDNDVDDNGDDNDI